MPERNEEANAKVRQALRHPAAWWKGAGLPEEKIRPLESGIQFFGEALKGFMKGYVSLKNHLYIGMGEGKIPPNWESVHKVAVVAWDAVNNPVVGSFMDRRRYSESTHRWIMRFNATLSPLFILLQCFNLGITPLQRVILWTALALFANLMSTTNLVSETKIWAGITPLDNQRSKVQLARTVGHQLSDVLNAVPMAVLGVDDLRWTPYQVMVYGAMLFAPFTIFSRWLPSFAKQRVDITAKVQGEDQAAAGAAAQEHAERPPNLREMLGLLRHNRLLLLTTVANMIRMFFPGTDYMYQYQFLYPRKKLGGKTYNGIALWTLKNVTFGVPCFLLQPLANKVVAKFRDKVQFLRFQELFTAIAHIGMYLSCYSLRLKAPVFTWPRLLLLFTIEMFRGIIDNWAPVPRETIKYEMFDYVEWKTGQRSDGVMMTLDRMLNGSQINSNLIQTSVKDNVNGIVSNAVKEWTGYQGWDIPTQKQPERFLKSIWPLTHWGKIAGGLVGFAALLFFKYPRDPGEVEADLIERRALAQTMREEAMRNA